MRFRRGPCPSSCAKHPRGVPTADLSKKARSRPRPATEISRGSGRIAKPKEVSSPSDAVLSGILQGFQEPSARRPRTMPATRYFVREARHLDRRRQLPRTVVGRIVFSRTIGCVRTESIHILASRPACRSWQRSGGAGRQPRRHQSAHPVPRATEASGWPLGRCCLSF